MKTIELVGHVDEQHQLHAEVPASVAPGEVKLLVLVPEGEEDWEWPAPDLTKEEWAQFVAHGLRNELGDPREDIYSLEDGEPEDDPR